MQKISRKTLTDQIYEILRDEIIQQNIVSGTRLQFKELQEKYSISSSPLREAMNRLYQDGLVTYFSNKGAQVVTFTEADVNEVYDLYCELDCIAIRYAFDSGKVEEMYVDLKNNLVETGKCLETGSFMEFNRLSDDFHNIIYSYANNGRLLKMANQLRGQFTILSNLYEEKMENRQAIYDNHSAILKRLIDHDIKGVVDLIRNSFNSSKSFVLERMKAADS